MTTKVCSKCGEEKDLETGFYKKTRSPDGFNPKCSSCVLAYAKEHYARNREKYNARNRRTHRRAVLENPLRVQLMAAKHRARRGGFPFDLTEFDVTIPEVCPVFGFPLERAVGSRGGRFNSPSLDRLTPALGYTRDNVVVVSHRANTIKNNATLEEMKALVAFYEPLLAKHAALNSTDPPTAGGDTT